MPRVKISISDLKCVRQADSIGKDDVFWIANLRSAPAVDEAHTAMARISYDEDYYSSLPEMVTIGAGETKGFTTKNVVYEGEVAAGSYVFGTVHFLERDTPLSNYFTKILALLGIIFGGLALAAVVGFAVGYGFGGMTVAIGAAIIGVVGVGLIGFFVGGVIDLTRPVESDAHLGGMRIVVGPLAQPPPDSDKDAWPLILAPSGKLEVVDAHGAELIIYTSSHHVHGVSAGHRYETALQLEITRGHR
jgi:hypothetical protein